LVGDNLIVITRDTCGQGGWQPMSMGQARSRRNRRCSGVSDKALVTDRTHGASLVLASLDVRLNIPGAKTPAR